MTDEKLGRVNTVAERLESYVGSVVVVEGIFPIPIGGGQVAHVPIKGKLTEVFEDGFAVQQDGVEHASVFYATNIRSVTPFYDSKITKVRSNIVMPGQ